MLLLALGAAQARADGEDDLPYGTQGTAFSPLGPVANGPTNARVDQGPDGGTVEAVAFDPDPDNQTRGFTGDDIVRVIHRDGAGTVGGLDGDGIVDVLIPSNETPLEILDVEALDDGTIVVVYDASWDGNILSFFRMEPDGDLFEFRHRFTANQDQDDGGCESFGDPVAAEVASASRIFALWNCGGAEVLTRYQEGTPGNFAATGTVLPERNEAAELELAPNGDLYPLVQGPAETDARGGPFSEVFRYNQDLVRDTSYGGVGGAVANGLPLAIGVDGAGRAAVWTEALSFRGDGFVWDVYRFNAEGGLDSSWSGDGLARLEHPDLGPTQFCSKGCFPVAELLSLADGRVIALAFSSRGLVFGRGSQEMHRNRAIARTTDAGALDPAWDGDGVKVLELEQSVDDRSFFTTVSEPDVQTDGKVLVPHVTESEEIPMRVPAPPDGWSANVTRLNATPPAVTENPPPPQDQPQTQQQQTQTQQQQPRSCTSRRVFRIRLRKGTRNRNARIVGARVTVNGKAVKVTRADRLRSRVNLRNLPKGRYRVRITVKLSNGKTVRETRRYRTCTRKIPHQLAPLRGR